MTTRHRTSIAALAALLAPLGAHGQLGLDLSEPAPPPAQQTQKAEKAEKAAPRTTRTETSAPQPARTEKAAAEPPRPEKLAQPKKAPEPMQLDALALDAAPPPPGAAAEKLAEARKLLSSGREEAAALALDDLVRQPALAPAHAEARVLLAQALSRLGLHRSAATRLDDAIASAVPGSPIAAEAVATLVEIADRSGDENLVLRQVGRLAGTSLPADLQDRFQYLLAKASYERGVALQTAGRKDEARRSFDDARRAADAVRATGGLIRARMRFVEALVAYAEGDGPRALQAFKEVVRLTNPRHGKGDPRLRELAFLQLARLHYEHRQNRYAIFYYGKLPQDGTGWLEALWESSYAYYRVGDYERALGNLLTLHSPYFQEEWYPESHLLKAIIYYENCRYPEARSILEGFERGYEPIHAALDRLASSEIAPAAFYDRVVGSHGDPDPRMALRLSRLALGDRNVKRLDEEITQVRREAGRGIDLRSAAFRESPLAKDLRVALDGERVRLQTEAGARARSRLEGERVALRSLLEQSLRVKVEVTRREREALEASLARGSPVNVIKDYRYSTAVPDEDLYWPYDGEFWRDELGTYAYTLTKGCRVSPRDAQAAR